MRLRVLFVTAGVSAIAAIVACGDLFHGTSFDTKCTADASAKGCPRPPVTELCAVDIATALARAEHACAWLAACESPMGQNRTGLCIANALMAYNCEANPNRKPIGDAYQYWLALANADDCAGIVKAVAPAGKQACSPMNPNAPQPYTGCGSRDGVIGNPFSRVQCPVADSLTKGLYENCAAYGKKCSATSTNDLSQCVGAEARACTTTKCSGQKLVNCDNDAGIDHGIDCAQFGDGTCIATGASPACKPSSTTVLAATNVVRCGSDDIAKGAVTGFEESVNCKVFTGVVDGGTYPSPACVPIDGGSVGITPRDACQGKLGCTDDICDKSVLRACVQGNEIRFDCKDVGLGGCNPSVKTQEDDTHAACQL